MKKLLFFLNFSLIPFHSAFAEYRVYQYIVQNNIQFEENINSNIVTSTLNPRAYLAYNGGSNLISVDLLRTWICPGNTSQQDLCPSPYGKVPEGVL